MEVGVIKFGAGNTASVRFALERLGARAVLVDNPTQASEFERLILPGVGAAAAAMRRLRDSGMIDAIRAFRRPLLGICLGLQLLYKSSEEGDADGLGILPGTVKALPKSIAQPSPHMGWTPVQHTGAHPLLEGVRVGEYFYFVHAYACPIDASTLATAEYGQRFAAIGAKAHAFGCQFHPERSGAAGARVLRNFLALPC